MAANAYDPDFGKRTHLEMSIEGMTFYNSTIGANFPGSEVFSAPVKTSVNGQLFGGGPYIYGGHVMKDVFMRFVNGRIVEAEAGFGNEGLQEILSQGVGARFLGEIAFGTNPALRRRGDYTNGLLNEKRAGTVHVAVGSCYKNREYKGKLVNVDNGNHDTGVHWDLTISMQNNGFIILDGEVISRNGRFLDKRLAILNPD